MLAADPETGRQKENEVLPTFVKETDTLVHLRIGGEEIITTETHTFYVDGEGWIPAGELTEEDHVLDSEGRRLQVEEKYVEKLEESVKVYNFEVEEYHTYYVGDVGILVHNKCWEDPPVKKTAENGSKGLQDIGKDVHGNSKLSTKLQHGYEIYNKETGEVVKTGISGQKLNKNGTSPRANRQVNKFNKEMGRELYEAEVVIKDMPNRAAALEWEQANTDRLWEKGYKLKKQVYPKARTKK